MRSHLTGRQRRKNFEWCLFSVGMTLDCPGKEPLTFFCWFSSILALNTTSNPTLRGDLGWFAIEFTVALRVPFASDHASALAGLPTLGLIWGRFPVTFNIKPIPSAVRGTLTDAIDGGAVRGGNRGVRVLLTLGDRGCEPCADRIRCCLTGRTCLGSFSITLGLGWEGGFGTVSKTVLSTHTHLTIHPKGRRGLTDRRGASNKYK